MNKKLVAVAIAGLLAAPLAQAQTANVTLYGRVNIDMEFVNGRQTNGSNPNLFKVESNSSRFGIRGTEALGGGLNAIFQIENGSVNMTSTGGNLAGRDSFLGLSGSWGTFKMGRFLAPYDDIHGIFGNSPTASTSLLSTASVWANGAAGQPENVGFDDRLRNSIRYDTPVMQGFRAAFQYATNENPAIGSSSNNISLGGFYNNGPVSAGIAYEVHNKARGTAAAPLSDRAFSIAGSYQWPGFLLAGVYERMKNDFTTSTDFHHDYFGVSGTLNVGPAGAVFMYVGKASDGKGSAPDGSRISGGSVISLAKGPDTGAVDWELSYSHTLSKRTVLYTGYHKINNERNAQYNFNINSVAGLAVGGKPGGFVAGMYHSF